MPPLEHGQYPAVAQVSVSASPAAPSLFSSSVSVSVINKSLSPVLCRFEARALGGPRPLDPEFVWVDAQTAAELKLPVPLRFPPARAVTVKAHHPATTVADETGVRAPRAFAVAFVLLLAVLAAGTGVGVFYRPAAAPHAHAAATGTPQVRARATPRRAAATWIGSLSVSPAVARSGGIIRVRYASSGASGAVRLIDGKGVPLASQPWNRAGETLLNAPRVNAPQRFTISLAVSSGKSTARARADVTVVPSSAAASSTATPGAVRIATSPEYVGSGEYFQVSVSGVPMNQVERIVLKSKQGATIAAHDAPSLRTLFSAPLVSKAERYFIVVTLVRNGAGRQVVQPVDVHPLGRCGF